MSNVLRKMARAQGNALRRKKKLVTWKLVVPVDLRLAVKDAADELEMHWTDLVIQLLSLGVAEIIKQKKDKALVQIAEPGSILAAITEEERKRRANQQKPDR